MKGWNRNKDTIILRFSIENLGRDKNSWTYKWSKASTINKINWVFGFT